MHEHPSGTVFFNDRVSIDAEIAEMMREVIKIEDHMRPVIIEFYRRFLVDSADQEELEYATLEQEIEVNLIHRSYASPKDIDICLGFDIGGLRGHPNFRMIEDLHDTLRQSFAQ